MRIGIFDSGIGGLSVLYEALRFLPDEEFYFYADSDHVPYGIKTNEEVMGYVDEIIRRMVDMKVDAIVIACNTATSVAAKAMREKYSIPIIGMEPAVKPAVEEAGVKGGRVLVMATPITIRENKLRTLLEKVDKDHLVDLLPMPGFVRMAESEIFESEEVDAYIEEQLAVLDKSKYTEVVLGCTHFNYFKPAIRKAFGENQIQLVDGNEGTVRHLADILNLNVKEQSENYNSLANISEKVYLGKVKFFESGRPVLEKTGLDRYNRLFKRLKEVYK